MFRVVCGVSRHYQRQHLSGVLVTIRQQLAAEFASRNYSYTAAVPRSSVCVCVCVRMCVCVCVCVCVCMCVYVYVYVCGPMLCGVFRCAAAQFCMWSCAAWCVPMRCRPVAFRVCGGFLRCRSVLHCPQDWGVHNVHRANKTQAYSKVAFRALAQSPDLLGVLRTN